MLNQKKIRAHHPTRFLAVAFFLFREKLCVCITV